MCLGIPLKVVKLKENDLALVSMGESYLEISTVFTPEVKEGDYVIVHAGFSISILNKDELEEVNKALEEAKIIYDDKGKG
ncbi:MAG TPA: HypC/HybG/HupF family hydrogenase formation chaperone [Caldisericia bacterium]|jgi:hydrogenase expression/formation protein HypC|nr:HypC/HybG/HupF family hydrogenase formation chaperone [Caldisericia bacterium]HPB34370.1 HypC/HybG/HupF family hydrogenase formation chaperone [Caldisericia bacterium]HQL66674.1 HypC/HybG/HupF family hydrogenase formation chaperone [Caldisericia bacterium]HQN48104.1 HypC/HybG/HupF family hydrogenase formation chaperone [Caldisericia bacterium]HQO99472.1 HypC/HybG/HupF family hydrogenase formation chaperone [Caldisericia bacterium]